MTSYADEEKARQRRERIVTLSRERYGTPRSEIEQLLARAAEIEAPAPKPETRPVARETPVEKTTLPPPVAPPPETKTVEPPPTAALPQEPKKEEKSAAAVADLGRGGAQHKAIQDRIKDEAEKLGFRVAVEKEVLDGAGNVDLVLSRDTDSIACEVTVTTTIDHEVGNVTKCFKAGFSRVALVAGTEERAEKLRAAVVTSFGEEKAKSVGCFVPDSFIAHLRDAPRTAPPAPVETRSRGGRVVRRTLVPISPEEAKSKEEQMLKLMAETMKKKKQGLS